MDDQKKEGKIKKFFERNKPLVIGAGICLSGIVVSCMCKSSYKKGTLDGLMTGFHLTNQWWDTQKPELNLTGLWEEYKRENPTEVVYQVGKGKWVNK